MQMRTTLRFSLLPVDMALVRKTSVGEDKGSNGMLLPGMQISASTVEICTEVPHKTKIELLHYLAVLFWLYTQWIWSHHVPLCLLWPWSQQPRDRIQPRYPSKGGKKLWIYESLSNRISPLIFLTPTHKCVISYSPLLHDISLIFFQLQTLIRYLLICSICWVRGHGLSYLPQRLSSTLTTI